jgi:hypothetical protein
MAQQSAEFLAECERRLSQTYRRLAQGLDKMAARKDVTTGFIQAGLFLNLVTREQIDALIDRVHVEEFGETIEERRKRRGSSWPEDSSDFDHLESPAYERVVPGRKRP